MPSAWLPIALAERFSTTPWEIEEAPADRFLFYRRLLNIEGEYSQAAAGLPSNEPLILDE